MPRSSVIEDDPYPLPKDTLFQVMLLGCEQITVQGAKRPFQKWEWTFQVVDTEYAGTEFKTSTQPKITTATETDFLPLARPLVEALLGRPLNFGEDIDTDHLVGGHAMATVKHLEPRPRKQGDGFWFNVELDEIFPLQGPGQAQQSAPALSGNVVQPASAPQDPWATPSYDEPPF